MTAAEIEQPKPERFWPGVPVFLVLALILMFFVPGGPTLLSAQQEILHWYALQLSIGHGMVFNPGQPVLLIPSPLFILLLAAIQVVLPVRVLGVLLLIQIAGANSMFRIARRLGLSYAAATIAGLLYVGVLWSGIGTAIPVMTTLCLLALDLAQGGRWILSGLAFAAAVLCHPEALLLALPMLFFATNQAALRQFGLALLLPLVIAILGLYLYYGPLLWSGLLLLKSDVTDVRVPLVEFAPYLLLAIPGAWGWYRNRNNPIVAVLGIWVALSLFVLAILLRLPAYYGAPAASAIILLALVGMSERKRPRLGYALITGIGLVAVIVSLAADAYSDDARALLGDINVPNIDTFVYTIGTSSTWQALRARTSPDQTMISFDGQFQPDVKAMIERGDLQSALIKYAPDVLLVEDSGRIQPKMLSNGAWARLHYQPSLTMDPFTMHRRTFERNAPIGQFVDQPVSATFGPQIRLTGLALSQAALSPGQLLRVRLDWDYVRSASTPVTVELRLESGEYVLALAQDTYEPSIFQAGPWSTYHTLTVDPKAWSGPVTLTVGVIINGGTAGRVPVVTLPINPD